MAVMIGFVVGYVLGAREGDKGAAELKEAWQYIRGSDEARSLVAQGIAMARSVVQSWPDLLADQFQSRTSPASALRPTG